jgi:transketolase
MTTGSLGQGMSTAIGIALGSKMNKWDNYTYLIIGDGECDEGQIWEGALFAKHNRLDNLIAFVDCNKQQLDGFVKNVLDTGDLGEKFAAFGWRVIYVNGHDTGEISDAVKAAKNEKGLPAAIILDTIKGNGVKFAAGVEKNHHMSFTAEQIDEAIRGAAEALEEAKAALAPPEGGLE